MGGCFHFEIPPLHSAETNIPNLESTRSFLPPTPPCCLPEIRRARGWGVLTEDAAPGFLKGEAPGSRASCYSFR